jgi:hypothetical protein
MRAAMEMIDPIRCVALVGKNTVEDSRMIVIIYISHRNSTRTKNAIRLILLTNANIQHVQKIV